MDDASIHARIEQLVAEEHELWQREAEGNTDDAKRGLSELLKTFPKTSAAADARELLASLK